MRIHHLNCGSLYPRFPRIQGIVYCLLVETNRGLVLVDTGFGLEDCTNPTRLMRLFRWAVAPVSGDVEETALRQIARLGFAREDVTHIVMTHLHLDHAGGLRDFPDAQVHVFRPEYEAAMHPRGFVELFYDAAHWAHGPRWVLHDLPAADGRKWFGFDCIPIVDGLSPEILMVPLPGHTRGHCGVAVRTSEGWLLHCGDAASPHHREADPHQLGDEFYQLRFFPAWFVPWLLGPHVPRLRKLAREHGDQVRLISSHDAYSFSVTTHACRRDSQAAAVR